MSEEKGLDLLSLAIQLRNEIEDTPGGATDDQFQELSMYINGMGKKDREDIRYDGVAQFHAKLAAKRMRG